MYVKSQNLFQCNDGFFLSFQVHLCHAYLLLSYDLSIVLNFLQKINFNSINFAGFASEQQSMSAEVIRKAYQATEEGFFSLVAKQWPVKPQIAAVGSCCLVSIICGGTLYVANVGDSRVVMGRLVKATGEVLAVQLSAEHNASFESIRQELRALHPDDSHIVVLKHNVWRVKGLIQVLFCSNFCYHKLISTKGKCHLLEVSM